MAIKLFEPALGEVPAKLRHLYVLDAELGGYKLDCDMDPFVHGLKSALQKQREENKRLRHILGSDAIPIGDISFVKGGGSAADVPAGPLPTEKLSA
jgi:hypothetical protein